ncbi:hypothetical protein [Nonomuraea typhae]|uniref:hypothetical protein n=1 Tax=Nonomuraea typhae TaxID=2603600 RepID=UPI0012F892B0|nr:hypothetical protein [Nonomuraea typhae]
MTDNEPSFWVYTCEEGAARLGNKVIKASTLARLARERKVPHTRNGRKVGWTEAQLAQVVEYLATPPPAAPPAPDPPAGEPPPAETPQRRPAAVIDAPTDLRPFDVKRGSRYPPAGT